MSSTTLPFLQSFEQVPSFDDHEALKKLRQKCHESFLKLGLPDMHLSELYKLQLACAKPATTHLPKQNLRIVFVNGYIRLDLSELPQGTILLPMNQAFKSYSVLLHNRFNKLASDEVNPFTLLNASHHQQGAFFYLPPKIELKAPIELISIIDTPSEASWVMPRLHIFVGKFSEAEFILRTQGRESKECFYNASFDFELDDEAKVSLVIPDIAKQADTLYSHDTFRVSLKRNSRFQAIQLSASGNSTRSYHVLLAGAGAEANLYGLSLLDANKCQTTNVIIDHQEPHTRALQLFKGVLDGKSRSCFQGTILVRQKAQKTESYQLNNNLILSDQAQAESMPNLEIFADDVKASHGATVGQLDPEQLFYLKSRGVSESVAQSMLIRGFCEDIIAKIVQPLLCKEIESYFQIGKSNV